jgi:hypothetical protein
MVCQNVFQSVSFLDGLQWALGQLLPNLLPRWFSTIVEEGYNNMKQFIQTLVKL